MQSQTNYRRQIHLQTISIGLQTLTKAEIANGEDGQGTVHT